MDLLDVSKNISLQDCILVYNYHPYDIKKVPIQSIQEWCQENILTDIDVDWINNERDLFNKGYNTVIARIDDFDAITSILAKKISVLPKGALELLKISFKFKQHFMEITSSSDDGSAVMFDYARPNGLEFPSIWSVGDDIRIQIIKKLNIAEDGLSYKKCGFSLKLPKEEFWDKSLVYGSREDNLLIPWLRDFISPIIEKYENLGRDVDSITCMYLGDPTIDWSSIPKNAVTFYEGIETSDSISYNVHFIMYVNHTKCKRDISVLRKMYSVYLKEGNMEYIEKVYKEKGKDFSSIDVGHLITQLKGTSKKESISVLGISDVDVLRWFDEIGNKE